MTDNGRYVIYAQAALLAIDVLLVEEMGKNVSGSGIEYNVVARSTNPDEPLPADPPIFSIVVLDLTGESHGNATRIGNADFTTRRLVDKIDMKVTFINCVTACVPNGAKVPATFQTGREAMETLHLGEVDASGRLASG